MENQRSPGRGIAGMEAMGSRVKAKRVQQGDKHAKVTCGAPFWRTVLNLWKYIDKRASAVVRDRVILAFHHHPSFMLLAISSFNGRLLILCSYGTTNPVDLGSLPGTNREMTHWSV